MFAATVGSNRIIASRLARQVAVNAWFVLVVSMLIGTYVLALFDISLSVVRIGGGLLVAATAWRMLHDTRNDRRVHRPRRPDSGRPRAICRRRARGPGAGPRWY